MNPFQKSLITNTLCGVLFLTCCVLTQPYSHGQQTEAPKYTMEEYKAYQEAAAETNAAKKTDLIVKFLQDKPQSTLREHVVAAYQGMMNDLQKAQNWSQLIASGEHYLKAVPDDVFSITMLATGYQRSNRYKQFVVFGEKTFEKKPDGNLAYYLAKAYKDLGDDAKFMLWGEKAVGFMPENHELLIELAKKFAIAGKNTQAAKYGRQCIKVLQAAKMPEGTDEKVWRDYTSNGNANCYGIVGNVAYEQKDYNGAVSNLENSVRFFKRNQMAYYYLGMSYWQLNKVDLAMLNLAKASLLPGPSAAAAKQHLDNLYKSTHQQSLVGQDKVIARARLDLK